MPINRRQLLSYGVGTGLSIAMYPLFVNAQSNDAFAVNTTISGVKVISGSAFGTQWKLSLNADVNANPAIDTIREIVRSVDQSMSPYRLDSELSGFNRLTENQPFIASEALSTVVKTSLDVASLSAGAFDPTVGPVVNRYGFGPVTVAASDTNTSRYTDISQHNNTLHKSKSSVTLDLCGIAKGFALDEITSGLSHAGYDNFLVELGGELAARGNHPNQAFTDPVSKRPWTIGIELPADSNKDIFRTLLSNSAIATSGVAHNSYQLRNKRYSHLINPHLQTVTKNKLFSVTVLSESAMLADAWSTALYVLGESKGIAQARQMGLSTLFISNSSSGLQYSTTGQFTLLTG